MTNIFTQTHYTFEGQRVGESPNLFLNQHWITIVLRLFGLAVLVLFPLIPLFALSNFIATYNLENVSFLVIVLFYIFIWSSAFYSITMYLLNTWIVTDERIIDTTQHGFFSRTVSEMSLSKVQDISVRTAGLIPTMFAYGDVEIQSAGTIEKFIFKKVPNPNQVKSRIMELVEQARAKELAKEKI